MLQIIVQLLYVFAKLYLLYMYNLNTYLFFIEALTCILLFLSFVHFL